MENIQQLNATDLRIGNLVTINNKEFWSEMANIPLPVVSISEAKNLNNNGWTHSIGLNYLEKNKNIVSPMFSQLLQFIQPIPLTEEWLLKFGFEYYEQNMSYQLDTEFNFTLWGRPKTGIYLYIGFEECGQPCETVHELQNLYYSLTKTELTYERPTN